MRPRTLLLAGAGLGLLVAALLAAGRLAGEAPPTPRASATLEAREGSPLERTASGPRLPAREEEASRAHDRPGPARSFTVRAVSTRAASEPETDLDEELRLTEEALEASRRLAARFEVEDAGPAPHPAATRRAPGLAAGAHACLSAGHSCRSGAECCPGLACAGGVAGYGTLGRCEAPR